MSHRLGSWQSDRGLFSTEVLSSQMTVAGSRWHKLNQNTLWVTFCFSFGQGTHIGGRKEMCYLLLVTGIPRSPICFSVCPFLLLCAWAFLCGWPHWWLWAYSPWGALLSILKVLNQLWTIIPQSFCKRKSTGLCLSWFLSRPGQEAGAGNFFKGHIP